MSLPYASAAFFGEAGQPEGLFIHASIGGRILRFQLDTGSRGVALSRDMLPPHFKGKGKAGHLFYWSSGNRLNGQWVDMQMELIGAVDGMSGLPSPAKVNLPVLIIDTVTCVAAPAGEVFPNHCSAPGNSQPARGVTMMGVGFDRTGYGDAPNNNQWNQQYNPFFNLDQMRQGKMRAGYILTPRGVQLGLTAKNTANAGQFGVSIFDFAFQKLLPTGLKQVAGSPPDWQAPTGFVRLDQKNYPVGQAVIDTGIPDLLLSLPGQPASGQLKAGNLSLSLLNSSGLVGYGLQIPNFKDPLNPASATWSPFQKGRWSENRMSKAFVNTGVRALNAFNFLYDGTGGYVGLQRNGLSGEGSVFLSPLISVQGAFKVPGQFETNLPILLQGPTDIAITGQTAQFVRFFGPILGKGRLDLIQGRLELGCDTRFYGTTVVHPGAVLVYQRLAGPLRALPGGTAIQKRQTAGPDCMMDSDAGVFSGFSRQFGSRRGRNQHALAGRN